MHITNQLKYGLQYCFRNDNVSMLQFSLTADTGRVSVLFSQGNNIQAVLDLLGSVSKVAVISAPRMLHEREDADDATTELEEKLPLLRGLPPPARPR